MDATNTVAAGAIDGCAYKVFYSVCRARFITPSFGIQLPGGRLQAIL
jgi:hypothetical protein